MPDRSRKRGEEEKEGEGVVAEGGDDDNDDYLTVNKINEKDEQHYIEKDENPSETFFGKIRRVLTQNVGFFLSALLSAVLLCILITLFVQKDQNKILFLQPPPTADTELEYVNRFSVFDGSTGEELYGFGTQRTEVDGVTWFETFATPVETQSILEKHFNEKAHDVEKETEMEQVYCNLEDGMLYIRTTDNKSSISKPFALLRSLEPETKFFKCKWVAIVNDSLVVGDGEFIDLQSDEINDLYIYVLTFENEDAPAQQKVTTFSEYFPGILDVLREQKLGHVAITSLVYEEEAMTFALATSKGPMISHQSLDGSVKTLGRADIRTESNRDEVFLTAIPHMKGMFCVYNSATREITIIDTNGTQCSYPISLAEYNYSGFGLVAR